MASHRAADPRFVIHLRHGLRATMRKGIRLAIFFLSAVACARHDPAVSTFDSHLARASNAITEAAAASYLYRFSETPEEQAMQAVMKLVRERRATRDDLQLALDTEQTRRAKYIDGLDESIEQGRGVVAELSRSANAIVDAEVRAAALKIVAHHERQLRLCAAIARAQRVRSAATESFIEALIKKEVVTRDDRFATADAQAEDARRQIEELASADELLVAEFHGVKERRDRTALW